MAMPDAPAGGATVGLAAAAVAGDARRRLKACLLHRLFQDNVADLLLLLAQHAQQVRWAGAGVRSVEQRGCALLLLLLARHGTARAAGAMDGPWLCLVELWGCGRRLPAGDGRRERNAICRLFVRPRKDRRAPPGRVVLIVTCNPPQVKSSPPGNLAPPPLALQRPFRNEASVLVDTFMHLFSGVEPQQLLDSQVGGCSVCGAFIPAFSRALDYQAGH